MLPSKMRFTQKIKLPGGKRDSRRENERRRTTKVRKKDVKTIPEYSIGLNPVNPDV